MKDLRYFFALCRLFRQIRPEVVVAWTTKCNIFSALAARQAQARKVIFSVRGLGTAFQEDASLKARVLNALVLSLYRVTCRAADVVVGLHVPVETAIRRNQERQKAGMAG